MKLYGGIDLHSNNSVVALSDEEDHVVYRKRLPNEAAGVLEALEPYREAVEGLVVESTYNWYWLVDALMEAGYRVHLGEHGGHRAIQRAQVQRRRLGCPLAGEAPASGFAARGLHLPQGGAGRARPAAAAPALGAAAHGQPGGGAEPVRAQPRARVERQRGPAPHARGGRGPAARTPNLALAVQSTLLAMHGQEAAIDLLERQALAQVRLRPHTATCSRSAASAKSWA